jgi:hypothetical protein
MIVAFLDGFFAPKHWTGVHECWNDICPLSRRSLRSDHLPLYRQSEIYGCEGVKLERSTT